MLSRTLPDTGSSFNLRLRLQTGACVFSRPSRISPNASPWSWSDTVDFSPETDNRVVCKEVEHGKSEGVVSVAGHHVPRP